MCYSVLTSQVGLCLDLHPAVPSLLSRMHSSTGRVLGASCSTLHTSSGMPIKITTLVQALECLTVMAMPDTTSHHVEQVICIATYLHKTKKESFASSSHHPLPSGLATMMAAMVA